MPQTETTTLTRAKDLNHAIEQHIGEMQTLHQQLADIATKLGVIETRFFGPCPKADYTPEITEDNNYLHQLQVVKALCNARVLEILDSIRRLEEL